MKSNLVQCSALKYLVVNNLSEFVLSQTLCFCKNCFFCVWNVHCTPTFNVKYFLVHAEKKVLQILICLCNFRIKKKPN